MPSTNSSDLFRAAAQLRMLGHPDLADAIVPCRFSNEALLAGKNLIEEANPAITLNHFQAALEMVLSYSEPMEAMEKGNGSENKQDDGEERDDGQAISSGTILPPFSFDTPEKLNALIGRKVELRDGGIVKVEQVDLKCDRHGADLIKHEHGWVYSNGRFWSDGENSDCDIVAVLPKEA